MKNDSRIPISDALKTDLLNAAKKIFEVEGTLEIDSDSVGGISSSVSTGDYVDELKENGGAYVKAWVWVPLDALSETAIKKFKLD
jgi:hypothetical protein